MKKSKITLGILAGVMGCVGLASCDSNFSYSPEGYILTYTDNSGNTKHYTADELFGEYYKNSSKVSTMFDNIYKLIVRNHFNSEDQAAVLADIKKDAQNDYDGIVSKAQQNADTNNTDFNTEMDALIKSYNCTSENDLLEHFIYERELEEFEDQFYNDKTMEGKTGLEYLRDNVPSDSPTAKLTEKYNGYLNKKVPYHVSHILVKVSDSAATNYWNATIEKQNALDLHEIAVALAEGERSFGNIARQLSHDSSDESFGELEIVDKDTSYVPEFKLGIYAYENIYNTQIANPDAPAAEQVTVKELAEDSAIAMDSDVISEYKEEAEFTADEIGTVPYGVFEKLKEYADVTTDAKDREVWDNNNLFYPRNVYFNKYLNRHSISLITPNDTVEDDDNFVGTLNTDYAAMAGFQDLFGDGNKYLCTTTGAPIFVVRAGTTEYQGIHFIAVERDGLIRGEVDDVNLSDYFTTYYPGQEDYPTDDDGNNLLTYVNSTDVPKKEYAARATRVENKIKNFDSSNLKKFIYEKFVDDQKVQFKDENLKNAIAKWIDTQRTKASFDEEIEWEKTWNSYILTLKQQNNARGKLVSETCAIGFSTHTGADWAEGGKCHDNKNR